MDLYILLSMDIEQLWTATLGALALTSTHLAGDKRISAWVVGMVSQCGWIGFMFLTGNKGFLVGIVGFTYLYIRNYLKWRKAPAENEQPVNVPRPVAAPRHSGVTVMVGGTTVLSLRFPWSLAKG